MSIYPLEYWEAAATRDPWAAVRTGWTERDFDTRTDDTLCNLIEFRPGDVVLDYGCGPGYACRLVVPKVGWYVGLDYSEAMLELARRRNATHRNAEFVKGDGVNIPMGDGYFDCVFCELVFQHLRREATLAIFEEIQCVLKPGGRALLQFPTLFYGKEIGFTVDELVKACPGWSVEADLAHPRHYIHVKSIGTVKA